MADGVPPGPVLEPEVGKVAGDPGVDVTQHHSLVGDGRDGQRDERDV